MNNEILRPVHYREMQTETRRASADYNAAARSLDLAQIRERNAELASQAFEHSAKGKLFERLGAINERERKIGLAFARYATYGRTDE